MKKLFFLILLLSCEIARAVTIEFGGYIVDSHSPVLDTFVEGSITYEPTSPASSGTEATYHVVSNQAYWINGTPLAATSSQGLIVRNDYVLRIDPSPIYSDGLIHRADTTGTYNGSDVLGVTFGATVVSYTNPSSLFTDLSLPGTLDAFVGTQASLALSFRDPSGHAYSIDSNTGNLGNGDFFTYLRVNGESAIIVDGLVSASAVPLPAAVWLFGSGLLGLIGMARKKAA